jgi:succinate dehydrogenase / fumarate reductase, cytochrome b subunit
MTQTPHSRPLSPHLQIYRPQISSVLSILHRMTGVCLALGIPMFVAWLWAAAYSDDYFNMWQGFFTSTMGTIMLMAWTAAFYYHLGNGIRHLFWDMGRGFDLKNVTLSGVAVLLFAAGATAATWCYILCLEASA